VENYLWYLENVLGLKTLVLPELQSPIETDAVVAEPVVKPPQVLFIQERTWSPAAGELFHKMREAMKLSIDQVAVLFADQASASELQVAIMSADRVVSFSQGIFQNLQKEPENKFLTHSPEDLLKRPELKKQAWDDLKLVMKSLGLL
jgi:hypothetical protein